MKSGEHSYESSGYEPGVFPGYWLPQALPKPPTDQEGDTLRDESVNPPTAASYRCNPSPEQSLTHVLAGFPSTVRSSVIIITGEP
jgi:hypothetical protein